MAWHGTASSITCLIIATLGDAGKCGTEKPVFSIQKNVAHSYSVLWVVYSVYPRERNQYNTETLFFAGKHTCKNVFTGIGSICIYGSRIEFPENLAPRAQFVY